MSNARRRETKESTQIATPGQGASNNGSFFELMAVRTPFCQLE